MTLEVKYSNQAVKFLNKCDKNLRERIFNKIDKLKENPFCKTYEDTSDWGGRIYRKPCL